MTEEEALQWLDRYRAGQLRQEERDRLFSRMMEDQSLYNAFAEQQIFCEVFTDSSLQGELAAAAEEESKQARTGHPKLGGTWPKLGWSWRFSLAVIGGLAVVIVWVLLVQSRRAPPVQVAEKTNPILQKQSEPRAPVALLLLPTTRGGTGNTIHLGVATAARLELSLYSDSFQSYSCRVRSADGAEVQDFDGLKPRRSDQGDSRVEIEIPAALLSDGDYTVMLSGTESHGRQELAGGYSFRIVR